MADDRKKAFEQFARAAQELGAADGFKEAATEVLETCWACGGKLQVIKNEPYQYIESGLDNVWLYGINQYKCESCGEGGPEIPKVDELHELLQDTKFEQYFLWRDLKWIYLDIKFERRTNGIVVFHCPELKGCVGQGRTEEQTQKTIRKAIKLCLTDSGD